MSAKRWHVADEAQIDDARLESCLIDMAIESWRFSRMVARLIAKLDAGDGARYVNQLRYFQRKIEEGLESGGLKLVNIEGQIFDPGMAASALNIGDFAADDQLVVEQMLEPIIMGADGIRKPGTVTLKKVSE